MSRRFDTGGAPHFPPHRSVASLMREVLYALTPGIVASTWFFGVGVLLQIALATLFALAFEWIMLRLRGQPVRRHMGDYSAVLTAVLFALCIPPLAPWWVSVTGMLFAIVFAKHLYGGLGQNVFNPAMVGYVVVLIAFPQVMALWPSPAGLGDPQLPMGEALRVVLTGTLSGPAEWDAITRATPLDVIRSSLSDGIPVGQARQSPVFGLLGGYGWEWIALAYAAGGLWMMQRRVISWHVPLAVLGSVAGISLVALLINPEHHPSLLFQVFSGGLMLAAFFIATDPVSGCASVRGRLVFGAGVGILTWVIRRWGGYPDGIAFAVLLMNMAAPLIDRFTRPRIYGHGS